LLCNAFVTFVIVTFVTFVFGFGRDLCFLVEELSTAACDRAVFLAPQRQQKWHRAACRMKSSEEMNKFHMKSKGSSRNF
jgi:hypothetical protein